MHSHRRARGKILFEVLCALSLAASFAGAWDQTGSSALLASASIMALFALYWAVGLFARDRAGDSAQPAAAVAVAPEAAVETAVRAEAFAREPVVQTEPEPVARVEVFAFEPDVPAEAEPVAATPKPKKRPARKTKKAAADVAPVVEQPEPVAVEEPIADAPPLEPLFDPLPFVRQPRPAFGRKSRGPRTLSAG
jgi:hypothetical protein